VDAARIKARLRRMPFQPVEIRLENGEMHVIRHPEAVAISDWMIVLLTPRREIVDFEPRAVTSIKILPRRNGRGSNPTRSSS
jgi:hypothetical protein